MAGRRRLDPNEIIYELIAVGGAVKVTAVDPESMAEVSIVGPPSASEADLMRLARRKLEYVLAKQGVIDPP